MMLKTSFTTIIIIDLHIISKDYIQYFAFWPIESNFYRELIKRLKIVNHIEYYPDFSSITVKEKGITMFSFQLSLIITM